MSSPSGDPSPRMVKCVKFGRTMPGLDQKPWPGELGQRIYEHVSADAWAMWEERMKMILNEYRLLPWQKEAQELVALLAGYHETVWVHPKIAEYCTLYRQAGVRLPEVEVPQAGAPPGLLVVMPPDFQGSEWCERIARPRLLLLGLGAGRPRRPLRRRPDDPLMAKGA